ncbi:MAG: manganese efflux pump MntP family protein [Treponemataceae bacterium]|nr:manganese efflux pump MntP family protein [Treponemataceae bacterium]
MGIWETILLGVGLSADAFAVSITDGMRFCKIRVRDALAVALTFGIFQAVMPLVGFAGGTFFYEFISRIDHWIALALLSFLGGKMLFGGVRHCAAVRRTKKARSAVRDDGRRDVHEAGGGMQQCRAGVSFRELFVQGVATSIDALAVGIALAAVSSGGGLPIYGSVSVIGATTFCICLPAVFLGKKTGDMLNDYAAVFGGLILIGIGVRIFAQHVFFAG